MKGSYLSLPPNLFLFYLENLQGEKTAFIEAYETCVENSAASDRSAFTAFLLQILRAFFSGCLSVTELECH